MTTDKFRQLTVEQFEQVLARYPFSRRIDAVHMHHTWSPDRMDYRGLETIVGMWRYHTQTNGWSDIAQHISIAPDGTIWTGRSWNSAPASSTGYNGSASVGPFMFETIGNFDTGHDRLEGAQLDTVIAVIALVQQKFGLSADTLRFHRQMTNQKSCPGNGVRRDDILARVRQYAGTRERVLADGGRAPASDMPFSSTMSNDTRFIDDVVNELLARGQGRPAGEENAELAEDRSSRDATTRASRDGRVDTRAGVRAIFSADELSRLTPHVVNLNQGELSSGGVFQTTPGDVAAIFAEHIPKFAQAAGVGKGNGEPPLRIVFFAHGGLVDEAGGLAVARKHIDWWKANQIYPIYFVWETGLVESLGQILSRATGMAGIPGARGVTDVIADTVTDPLIASICHTIGGVQIWGSMKLSAQRASEPRRGARLVAEKLREFLAAPEGGVVADQVELHAVGHSAGSIFHSYFVPVAADEAGRSFRTVQFLAPAVRVDTFKETLWPRIASPEHRAADRLSIFTMKDALERDDDCGPYRKSLLYLIHDGLEPRPNEPILGLERSLRGDADLARELVNAGATKGEVLWSVTEGRTTSRTHGGFDDDTPTMNSVARRVLSLRPEQPLAQDFNVATERDEGWFKAAREIDFTPRVEKITPLWTPGWAAQMPTPVAIGEPASIEPVSANGNGGAPTGARRALCIGIDQYPTAPLSGCVADARLWSEKLRALGFTTRLLVNGDATRDGILSAVDDLVGKSKAGDVLVLQYSGHGTTVPDENEEEEDGKDQAVCPFDFADGHLLVDDDVAMSFTRLPAGVTLTCFFDCCHSGTITRFAVGDSPASRAGGNRKARFVVATPDLVARHRAFRRSRGLHLTSGTRAFSTSRGPAGMREVVFSACRRDEVAMESDGQGEFTRRAVQLLDRTRMTNKEFQERVVAAFGARPAQHPILDCAPEVEGNALLGGVAGVGPGRPTRAAAGDGYSPMDAALELGDAGRLART